MNRCLFLFLSLTQLLLVQLLPAKQLALNVHAESALLINAETGVVLYEKNANTLQYPASITKVATALYALTVASDQLDTLIAAPQDAVVSIPEEEKRRSNYTKPAHWLVPGGTHIGIKKDEELSLNDLLHGMMMASGNDAANVIAHHIGGSIPNFMIALNAYLKEIGCTQTSFTNPHGLFHPKHQTTAHDMAIIMREALKIPKFCDLISCLQYTRPKTNKQEESPIVQTNRLLKKGKFYYPKALGGKTGYLALAANTLVAAAEQDGRVLIAVQLKCKEREELFRDAIKMFDAAFNQAKVHRLLLKAGDQTFTLTLPGTKQPITTYTAQDVSIDYFPSEEPQIKCMLLWDNISLPVAKNQQVGELHICTDRGQLLHKVPLFSREEVEADWLWSIKNLF